MHWSHCPALPESPIATLGDDCQSKAAPAHRQAASYRRDLDPIAPSALRIWATLSPADDQVTTTQQDEVCSPERITALQDLPAAGAGGLLWPIVTLGNLAIVFSSSPRYTSVAQGS